MRIVNFSALLFSIGSLIASGRSVGFLLISRRWREHFHPTARTSYIWWCWLLLLLYQHCLIFPFNKTRRWLAYKVIMYHLRLSARHRLRTVFLCGLRRSRLVSGCKGRQRQTPDYQAYWRVRRRKVSSVVTTFTFNCNLRQFWIFFVKCLKFHYRLYF